VVTYVVTRPARELLFTVVSQDEKYKAKVCYKNSDLKDYHCSILHISSSLNCEYPVCSKSWFPILKIFLIGYSKARRLSIILLCLHKCFMTIERIVVVISVTWISLAVEWFYCFFLWYANVSMQVCIDVIVQRLGDATAAAMYKLLFSTLSGKASAVSLYALPVSKPSLTTLLLMSWNYRFRFIQFQMIG